LGEAALGHPELPLAVPLGGQAAASRSSVTRSVTRWASPSTITSSPWSHRLQPVVMTTWGDGPGLRPSARPGRW
jgi:hypothetical protein